MKDITFKGLSLTAKSSLLYSAGTPLSTRLTEQYQVKLYAIYEFYVEVHFAYGTEQVENIIVLEDSGALLPHLQQITLPQLF